MSAPRRKPLRRLRPPKPQPLVRTVPKGKRAKLGLRLKQNPRVATVNNPQADDGGQQRNWPRGRSRSTNKGQKTRVARPPVGRAKAKHTTARAKAKELAKELARTPCLRRKELVLEEKGKV